VCDVKVKYLTLIGVHVIDIGLCFTGDDALAKTIDRFDDHFVQCACTGIGCEQDAGYFSRYKLLHNHRHGDVIRIDALFLEIGLHTLGLEALPAFLHGYDDCVGASDI